tara:strand:- start:22 stop:231 length:210 start_codon:yes stop_codon:yes gene_type:complete
MSLMYPNYQMNRNCLKNLNYPKKHMIYQNYLMNLNFLNFLKNHSHYFHQKLYVQNPILVLQNKFELNLV